MTVEDSLNEHLKHLIINLIVLIVLDVTISLHFKANKIPITTWELDIIKNNIQKTGRMLETIQ